MNRSGGNFANTPGPTPGPDMAIRQHHAMASGVVLPKPERKVDTMMRGDGETGKTDAPGLTSRNKKPSRA